MSFIITVYVPTAIVMASDSRQSIRIESTSPEGKPQPVFETVSSDYINKTLLLEERSQRNAANTNVTTTNWTRRH